MINNKCSQSKVRLEPASWPVVAMLKCKQSYRDAEQTREKIQVSKNLTPAHTKERFQSGAHTRENPTPPIKHAKHDA
jgi:hypothetical protein